MAKNSARGTWDSNDKRTKAGRSKSTYHPHKDLDAVFGLAGSLFANKKKVKSTSKKKNVEFDEDYDFDYSSGNESSGKNENIGSQNEKLSVSMKVFMGVLAVGGIGICIVFWLWIASLF